MRGRTAFLLPAMRCNSPRRRRCSPTSPRTRDLALYTSDSRELVTEKAVPGVEIGVSTAGIASTSASVPYLLFLPSTRKNSASGFNTGNDSQPRNDFKVVRADA